MESPLGEKKITEKIFTEEESEDEKEIEKEEEEKIPVGN